MPAGSAPSTEPMVNCPQCGHGFKLTETLAAPIVAAEKRALEIRLRAEFGVEQAESRRLLEIELSDAKQKAADADKRELSLLQREQKLKADADGLELELAKKLAAEEAKITARAKATAEAEAARKHEVLERNLAEKQVKLEAAEKVELEAMQLKTRLDDDRRTFELDKARAVEAAKQELFANAKKEAVEQSKLKDAEKDKRISDLMSALEDAKRKAEQGSQQLQGEVQELELESRLRSRFPTDQIEPVGKGETGGDALHRVYDPPGVLCGTILWESKRTKAWSDGWLPKLRDDQRAAKAEAAIIVSQVLPKGLDVFGEIDRVWVTSPKTAMAVAACVREGLVAVAAVRRADEGLETKAEALYAYLTGSRFKQRVEAMVEAFRTLKEQLDSERRAFEKQWAVREKQLDRFMKATVGMYGDVQGIAGSSVPKIAALEADPDALEPGAGNDG